MSKPDGHIFISYAREDRGRVANLAKLLEAEGRSVWWDRENMSAGRPLGEIIESAINDASCVLVCWSKSAIKSRWVIDEAAEGHDQRKLLPVLFDAVKPPIGFRNIHHINLTEWDDKATHADYQRLKNELIKNHPLIITDKPAQQAIKVIDLNPKVWLSRKQALIDQLDNPSTEPKQRLAIGDELAKLGDPRPGVGLDQNGLPDIDWVEIPAGEFLYGEKKEHQKIETFSIARFPVTNKQYDAFIYEEGYSNNRWWHGISERITEPEKATWKQSNRPRETVNWYEAIAFCHWLTQRLGYPVQLPTEQQWERAARGIDGREYPWGNGYRSGYANVNETYSESGPNYLKQTTAVGIYPTASSPEGIFDLAGNVWEWCLNEYDRPKNIAEARVVPRVLRGGSWFFDPDDARSSDRGRFGPDGRSYDFGFRVVCSSPIKR